ncbi:hypothetical protein [Ferrovum myxofaciens]|uniref:hypothetical protein n=1 Tax=Ferrovum myxofaciens TaxID=416213 RepID=UPI003EBA4D70
MGDIVGFLDREQRLRNGKVLRIKSLPGGSFMKLVVGALSSCVSLRVATAAMAVNRLHLPVINNSSVSAFDSLPLLGIILAGDARLPERLK